jgi:hypothetical protein
VVIGCIVIATSLPYYKADFEDFFGQVLPKHTA